MKTNYLCGDLISSYLSISSKLKDSYDAESRCIVDEDGVANRYIGQPEEIVAEIERAGFEIIEST